MKNPLVWNHKALSLDIRYEASSGRSLPSLFKLEPWGQKWPRPRDHMLYIGLNRGKHKKIFLSETIRPRALIFWYVASPCGLLPSLFKLCPWGQKWPCLGGHLLYEDLYREKHEKIFLSEAIRPRALIYWYEASSSRLLPSLFKLYPWSQKWSRPGGHVLHRLI